MPQVVSVSSPQAGKGKAVSDFETILGFQDCWGIPKRTRTVKSPASGYFNIPDNEPVQGDARVSKNQGGLSGQGRWAGKISPADKARLARVVKGAPEVMVKVSKPARHDKTGNPIHVTRGTEGVRVGQHLSYISRNGKLELENDRGEKFDGKQEIAAIYREWVDAHDEDRHNAMATDRTRITTSIVFSMPGSVNAIAVKDAVRSLAEQEFKGRHDYVMALHTDTKNPHVHLTVRTVGHDGVKLNFRKADLQHLRETFAQKLRQRGIEAEATPRHTRGVTRKGEATPVYKIRQRGGKPFIDARKKREVQRDLAANEGRLPQKPWDNALVARRNRVMSTYGNAARILEQSEDPADRALGEATRKYAARLTDVTTQRAVLARSMNDGMWRRELASRADGDRIQRQSRDHESDRGKGRER